MEALFNAMSRTHGVVHSRDARDLGVTWEVEERLVAEGVLDRPASGVLRAVASTPTWHQAARIATLAPGDGVVSHGAAARLHGLDGFERYDHIDVLCRKGWWPNCPAGTIRHFTRADLRPDIVELAGIRTLSVGATLALLPASERIGPVAKALDSALRGGATIDDLRTTAVRWSRRGRKGPRITRLLLDERDGKTLPASWFQRLVRPLVETHGARFVDEWEVRSRDGRLLARLDLADPALLIGVECQSWAWHATPDAQHRDARRRGMLRQMGWEIIDVWWRDLDRPERVRQELAHLIRTRRRQLSA